MPTPRIPVFNPVTGQLELGEGTNRYGTSGELLGDIPGGGSIARSQGYDPRYYEQYQRDIGDSNTETAWRLRQDVLDRMGDRIQVHQPGVVGRNADGSIMEGQGFNEILDPSQVTWDDEFGWVMPRSNLSGSDPDDKARWDRIRAAAIAATIGGAAYASGAIPGLGTGAEGSAGGNVFSQIGDYVSGSLSDASSWAQRLAGQAGEYLGSAGAEQLSGPGMEGITGTVGNGAGSGGSMSWLTELFGGGGSAGGDILGGLLNRSDILRLIGAAGGTFLNGRQAGNLQDDQQAFQRELLAAQRNDVNTPFGSSSWAQGPDGRWTNTQTLNAEDQARLDEYRRQMGTIQSQNNQLISRPVDFQAIADRYKPQAFGGQYVGTDWIGQNYDSIRRRLHGGGG